LLVERKDEDMKFKKVKIESRIPGGKGYNKYVSDDGRFEIRPIYVRGGPKWQARTTDGSTPFRGYRKPASSEVANYYTIGEAKEDIARIAEKETA